MILKCSCAHGSQDRLHGAGNRVHNPCKDSGGQIMWRCTVCKTEKLEKSAATKTSK